MPGQTFADNYNGDNISADFQGAISATAGIMGTGIPPVDPDDVMTDTLVNWPDS
jgi:hypothetical protein